MLFGLHTTFHGHPMLHTASQHIPWRLTVAHLVTSLSAPAASTVNILSPLLHHAALSALWKNGPLSTSQLAVSA